MRSGRAFTHRRENFALNRARDLVRLSNAHIPRHAQVHINKVQSTLMPMSHRRKRADRGCLSRTMSIEHFKNPAVILRVLRAKNRGQSTERHACSDDDKQHPNSKGNGGIDPCMPGDAHRNKTCDHRERCPQIGKEVLSIADERRRSCRTSHAKKREPRDAVEHRACGNQDEAEIQSSDLGASAVDTLCAVGEDNKSRHRNEDTFEKCTDKLNRTVSVRMLLIGWTLGVHECQKRTNRRDDVDDALKGIAENRIGTRCKPTCEFEAETNHADRDRPPRRPNGAA